MDLQAFVIAAVSALFGAVGKEVATHVVQLISPTARLKRAEAAAKRDAPAPPPPPPQFVIPESFAIQAKHVELVQLRDELSAAQDALRRLRIENESLRLGGAMADALGGQLREAHASLHQLRATADAQAAELAAVSAQLQLSRAHNVKLVGDIEELRTQEPTRLKRPDKVLPEFRVERIGRIKREGK